MALPHPPAVHPAHASPAVSHPPQHLMQQPGHPGPSGMPLQYVQGYPNVRPPQPGMTVTAQQAAQLQQAQRQQQLQLSQQQLSAQQAALVAAQQQQAQQAQAQAHAQAQQQQQAQHAAAAAAAQQQQAGQIPQQRPGMAAHHMSPSPHIQHQFPVNGGAAVHPQYPTHPHAGVAVAQGPRPAAGQMRPPRPVHQPPQQAGMVQQHFQQHPGLQPGQQPGGVQHPHHVAVQMPMTQPGQKPQPQQGAPGAVVQGGPHHQPEHQSYDMSRVGSVQSQIGAIRDPEALLRTYIHDYLIKHELHSTAQALRSEAQLGDQSAVAIHSPKGSLLDLWAVFWELAMTGRGPAAWNTPTAFNDALARLRGLRQTIVGPQAAGTPYPGGTPIQRNPSMDARQQQQAQHAAAAAQQAQALAQQQAQMSPAQHALMQQQMSQQQHQQLLHQQQQQQQQAQVQAAAAAARLGQQAGPTGSPAHQQRPPPPGQHVYATPQPPHMMQPPAAQPNHPSPVQPSPRMAPQHGGVMPSPLQKHARPPPGMAAGTPTMMAASMAPHQQAGVMQAPGGTFMQPATPQTSASPAPMTPQQQQMQVQQQHQHQQAILQQQQGAISARAHMLQQQAEQTYQQQHLHQQQAAQQHAQQQAQHQAMLQQQHQPQVYQNGPMTPQHLQQFQQQQMANQQMANHYAGLGLGQVNPNIMQHSVHQMGLAGRDVNSYSEDEKQRLIRAYRQNMTEGQRRQMTMGGPAQSGVSPAATPQFQQQVQFQQQQQAAQVQAAQQAAVQAQAAAHQQRQVSGARPHSAAFEGSTPQDAGRDSTPPDRKRQRRNSGSAAPSPFTQPQQLQPGFQTPQQPGMVMQQQMGIGRMNGPMDAHSPAMPGQSPRTTTINGIPGQTMQRNQSKSGDGSMPPPQSPAATTLGRQTPQQKVSMTPKMQKEEAMRDSATPKSLRNSPNTGLLQDQHGLTPSPPGTNGAANGPGPGPASAPASSTPVNPNPNSGPNAMLNGVVDPQTQPQQGGSNQSLGFGGDMLGDSSGLFGTDTDLDWMLTAGGDGIDFALYLENIGEDNEGEVGLA